MDASSSENAINAFERDRIALGYELHDGILQRLHAVKMHLESAAANLLMDSPVVMGPLEKAIQQVSAVLKEGRSLVSSLTFSETLFSTDHATLWSESREQLIQQFTASESSISVIQEIDARPWPDLEQRTLFQLTRIVEQALLNVLQHSGASTVTIQQSWGEDDKSLWLRIVDDGRGFTLRNVRAHRYGLASMRFRAQLIGAKLSVQSKLKVGTTIEIQFPN